MEEGVATACFSTGMAAIAATFIALLRAGDHVVSSSFLFGNTNSLFGTFNTLGCEISFVDATDVDERRARDPAQHAAGVRGNHRQPAHPGRRSRAHRRAVRASRGLLYVVDNTMTSPYLYLPKRHHAGLIINSLTKYIGGHGNALGGAVTDTGLFDWTRFPNIYDNYKNAKPALWGILQIRKKGLRDVGSTLAAEPAHRIATGAETLALRMERACAQCAGSSRASSPRIPR